MLPKIWYIITSILRKDETKYQISGWKIDWRNRDGIEINFDLKTKISRIIIEKVFFNLSFHSSKNKKSNGFKIFERKISIKTHEIFRNEQICWKFKSILQKKISLELRIRIKNQINFGGVNSANIIDFFKPERTDADLCEVI